ncbi:MAG: aconitate hydratase [Tannerellaceae bacterium]|jgi:aconitate hydratase|nr:aconitate hydratase [Tannerellaceae bacterium]
MAYDLKLLELFYNTFALKVSAARAALGKPLTLTEKILYAHLYSDGDAKPFRRGDDYVNFRPDRVAMQDATAQMALLQFMNSGRPSAAVPTTVHCDHLIRAHRGAAPDLAVAEEGNREVYDFLRAASGRYGIGFWKPGAGIIHQIVLENYAFPGGMMVGTDSHTPNAGGLGMIAVGVGGADAVDVMSGMEWELKMPRLIGVKLTGRMSGWTSAKDLILKLAGILTVKGGTNSVIEYFGEGTASLAATGKATVCNMGAEVGATASVFPYDGKMADYLRATGRPEVAGWADAIADSLRPDAEIEAEPLKYFDRVIEINLSELEPYLNGPFTPDAATPISELAGKVRSMGYPMEVSAALIGSCTNSSWEDLSRAASIARQARTANISPAAPLFINPGSEQIYRTAEADGLLKEFERIGATVMANACGPCIGQWKRETADPEARNSIVTSFNRNFAKRADGNPNTHAFVASPEITMAMAISGNLTFNPLTDKLVTDDGREVMLDEPAGSELPAGGFIPAADGYVAPRSESADVRISPSSERLQILAPFAAALPDDFRNMRLLIKTSGKCTTDHISMAGPWLRFRGHLENISDNMLMGAVNAFNGKTNSTLNALSGVYEPVSSVAKLYKMQEISSAVVAEENYGEGSSREHAAMEPRFLNVKLIIAKSFARIHETNLKKQGMLAVTFADKADYNKVREDDCIAVGGINGFAPGKPLLVTLRHSDGSEDKFSVNHTYNKMQIEWFWAGSALNYVSAGSPG